MLKRGAKLLGREAFEKPPTDGDAGNEDSVDEGELLGGIQHRHPTVQSSCFGRDRQLGRRRKRKSSNSMRKAAGGRYLATERLRREAGGGTDQSGENNGRQQADWAE